MFITRKRLEEKLNDVEWKTEDRIFEKQQQEKLRDRVFDLEDKVKELEEKINDLISKSV